MNYKKLLFSLLFGCFATACTPYQVENDAVFWQRAETQSAIHLRGPKAQHTLNKDIANCVIEIKELTRLRSLREVTPPNTTLRRSDGLPIGHTVAGFDSPRYDGPNYSDYFNYADFEGCMDDKGWGRVDYLPYDIADKSRIEYIETLIDPNIMKNLDMKSYPDDYPDPMADYRNLNN